MIASERSLGRQRLVDASERSTKSCKAVRVDLGADRLRHDRKSFRDRHRSAIRPVCGEHVEDISGRDDSGVQADLVSREATRIAFAVRPLMMRAGDRGEFVKCADTDRIASECVTAQVAVCILLTDHMCL
jgi:hypothetical protein